MRERLAISIFLSLSLVFAACGGTGAKTQSGSAQPSTTAVLSTVALPLRSLENDRDDDDDAGEAIGFDPHDSDVDGDNDHAKPYGYYDKDDTSTRTYGHAANASEARELTAFAKRYYAAAAAGDGAVACSMLSPPVAKSVPQDYGRGSAGPVYLRSGSTCAEVLTLLFKHIHAQVSVPFQIIGMRVQGDEALVLIGARSTPASYFELSHEGRAWRSLSMLAYPLS